MTAHTNPLRVGVVGMGRMGRRYAKAASSTPDCTLVAVADIDQVPADCPVLPRWQDIFDAHVDALVVATPPDLRGEICVAAAAAGTAVLVEKPVVASEDDYIRLTKIVDDVPIQVAHQLRFRPEIRNARDIVTQEDLGEIVSVTISGHVRRDGDGPDWYYTPARGGGVIMESLCHSTDLARWLTGAEFESISAEALLADHQGTLFDHTVAVVGTLNQGATITMTCSYGGPPMTGAECRVEIIGTDGILRLAIPEATVEYATTATQGQWTTRNVPEHSRHDGFTTQWKTFTQVARGLARPNTYPTLRDGLHSAQISLAARQSMLTGQRIAIPADLTVM